MSEYGVFPETYTQKHAFICTQTHTYIHMHMQQEEDPVMLQFRIIAWNACSDSERDAFLWPKTQEAPEDKHIDNLMRSVLQVYMHVCICT
jgi:hypothetical protein